MRREIEAVQSRVAARLIGCSNRLVTRLVVAGRLPTVPSADGREKLIPVEAIERFAVRAISDVEVELTVINERTLAGLRYERQKSTEIEENDHEQDH